MVEYQVVQPTFELQRPTFNYVKPAIDTPTFDYTPHIGTNVMEGNVYDDLLDNLEVSQPQQTSKIGNFDINKAITTLHSNVNKDLKSGGSKDPKKSGHMCARAVRLAMEAGGLNTSGHPNYGGQYGQFLKNSGWSEVSDEPQKGDIAVTKPHGSHSAGHVSMYDGEKWISDYIQRDKFVYSSANDNNTTVYRYNG